MLSFTRLSVMMFLQFFIWGAWFVTANNFVGIVDQQTGWDRDSTDVGAWIYSMVPLAAMLSPVIGSMADRRFASQKVLGTLHLLGGAAFLLLPSVIDHEAQNHALPVLGLILLHALCYMPTLGLSNTVAMANIDNTERTFPLIRVFGTLGWIAANVLVSSGLGVDTEGATIADSLEQFRVAGFAAFALGLFSFALPHTPAPMAGIRTSFGEALGLGAVLLLRDLRFLVFAVSSFLICIPLAGYYSWTQRFIRERGISETPATMQSYGQWAEVLFMLIMPLCFRRLGVKWMLAVGMLAWVVRYGLFALGADDAIYWMILGGIVLHGICYDFFFVAGQIYTEQVAGRELRAQAQAFLVLITQGVGMFLGQLTFGSLVDRFKTGTAAMPVYDWTMIWAIPAGLAGIVLVFFVLLFRPPRVAPPAD